MYLPKVGGLENIASGLAQFFSEQGHDVKVISLTPGKVENISYEIIQFPSAKKLFALVKWCDVFLQFNVSLKGLWPLFFLKRKYVISHQSTNYAVDGSISILGRLKLLVSKFALNISCSHYVNEMLPVPGKVIPNFYDEKLFRRINEIPKDKDMVFLGRLVSDKGCHLLLHSLSILAEKNIRPDLTIIGNGPEEENLKKAVEKYNLQKQVTFTGVMTGEALVKELNRYKIMVVPSLWNEPFGIVALEGIACSCMVIGSEGGGLKDAIGKCGFTFKNSDAIALAKKLEVAILKNANEFIPEEIRAGHLRSHTINYIGTSYIESIS
jgi:glycogen synthase